MDYPFTLKEQYGDQIKSAVIRIAGSQEAEDLLSEFWLDVFAGECPEVTESQLMDTATTRARKHANRRQKDKYKVKTYTDTPPAKNTFGVLTSDELCKICSKDDDLMAPDFSQRLGFMSVVFGSLPPVDQEFLKAYQHQPVRELTLTYGLSEVALRQRRFRLKQRITKDLSTLIK